MIILKDLLEAVAIEELASIADGKAKEMSLHWFDVLEETFDVWPHSEPYIEILNNYQP